MDADLRPTLYGWLEALEHVRDGNRLVNERDHSLQTAARAEHDGADDEVVVAALFHDCGKAVTDWDHGVVVATLLRPFVRRDVWWTVRVHEDFTALGLENGRSRWARARHRAHPGYASARKFVDEYDLPAVDPNVVMLDVDHFRPAVDSVLDRARYPAPMPPRWRARSVARRVLPDSVVARIKSIGERAGGSAIMQSSRAPSGDRSPD